MKRWIVGVVAAAALAFVAWVAYVNYDLRSAGDAWIKCKDVKPGMTLEQATAIMGKDYAEKPERDFKGRIELVFAAPKLADTVPILYLNPTTKVVEAVACQ